jgi:hypothetical protein
VGEVCVVNAAGSGSAKLAQSQFCYCPILSSLSSGEALRAAHGTKNII